MITVRIIDCEHKDDIHLPNRPFRLYGRMIPSYDGEVWSYRIEYAPEEQIGEMCFPDEHYSYDKMIEDHVFLGAYEGERCIGLAILRHDFLKYMYLYDLKIDDDFRGKGVGTQLIREAIGVAVAQGYRGLYTQGQDNNLGACSFYLKCGFVIGGLDTHVYTGTSQEGKRDILFYYDAVETDGTPNAR